MKFMRFSPKRRQEFQTRIRRIARNYWTRTFVAAAIFGLPLLQNASKTVLLAGDTPTAPAADDRAAGREDIPGDPNDFPPSAQLNAKKDFDPTKPTHWNNWIHTYSTSGHFSIGNNCKFYISSDGEHFDRRIAVREIQFTAEQLNHPEPVELGNIPVRAGQFLVSEMNADGRNTEEDYDDDIAWSPAQ